jgi:hypothetical protein
MILGRILALWQAGPRIVLATDAGIGPGKPHDAMAYTALQLAAVTRDPVGALRAATSQAADALGLADTCGPAGAGARCGPARCPRASRHRRRCPARRRGRLPRRGTGSRALHPPPPTVRLSRRPDAGRHSTTLDVHQRHRRE